MNKENFNFVVNNKMQIIGLTNGFMIYNINRYGKLTPGLNYNKPYHIMNKLEYYKLIFPSKG